MLAVTLTERESDNARELTLVENAPQPVDVGANCGRFSLASSQKVGEAGRVIAIEPNPIMSERSHFNISANGFRNIAVAACAVGDVTGTAELQVCAGELGQSGLNQSLKAALGAKPTRHWHELKGLTRDRRRSR